MSLSHPHFVPNDTAGNRRQTAVLLVGTADEKGIDQRAIASTHTGFYINDEMADALDGTEYAVKRDTNPYATVDGPLADRRLDLSNEHTGPVGDPEQAQVTTTTISTVDGPLADTRLDIHNEQTGVLAAPEIEADTAIEADDEDDLDLEDDEDEDEDVTEDAEEFTYDPAEIVSGNIKSVKKFVTENAGTEADILAAERAGQNRETLVDWLNERSASDESTDL